MFSHFRRLRSSIRGSANAVQLLRERGRNGRVERCLVRHVAPRVVQVGCVARTHTFTHSLTHAHTHSLTHSHKHTHTNTHTQTPPTFIHTKPHTYTYIHANTPTHWHVLTHAHTHTHIPSHKHLTLSTYQITKIYRHTNTHRDIWTFFICRRAHTHDVNIHLESLCVKWGIGTCEKVPLGVQT